MKWMQQRRKRISLKCSSKIELFMDQSLTTSEIASASIQLYLLAQLERSASPGSLMIFWELSFHFGQELMPTEAAKKNHLNFHMYSNKTSIYFFCLFSLCNILSWPSCCASFRRREILLDMSLCLKGWEADKYWDDISYTHTNRWYFKNYIWFFLYLSITLLFFPLRVIDWKSWVQILNPE